MGGMSKRTGDSEVISAINVTPFVDVVLVLLVILMVTSVQIVKASFEVNLPQAASGGDAVDSTLNIVIEKSGRWLLDGKEIAKDQLASRVVAAKAKNPEVQAVIDADREVVYDRVVEAIDVVKGAGVSKFALNLQRKSKKAPSSSPPAGGPL